LLSKADVVVVNGLGLEGWVDRLIKASGFKGELVVASTGVKTHTLNEEENGYRPSCVEQRR
jgi:zinc/manganese transport system substrate-binding protein